MNRQDLENRLKRDAEGLRASCPPHVSHTVASRIRQESRRPEGRPEGNDPRAGTRTIAGLPGLAGACALALVFVSVWTLWPAAGLEERADKAADNSAGLNAAPIVASSDRLMASREAALEVERQLLERDLRQLRDHLTATFASKTNG